MAHISIFMLYMGAVLSWYWESVWGTENIWTYPPSLSPTERCGETFEQTFCYPPEQTLVALGVRLLCFNHKRPECAAKSSSAVAEKAVSH